MSKYEIVDVSMPMDAFVFPSNPQLDLQGPFNRVPGNNPEYVYDFKLCTQTGTHIQGPHYFLSKGKKISEFSLDHFEGEAYIFDSHKRGEDILAEDFIEALDGVDLHDKILVIRTGHMRELIEEKVLRPESRPGISLKAAEYLCQVKGIKMIAIDSLGVESLETSNHEVNVYLCEREILILEGLVNLENIKSKSVWLEAFPLSIMGVEGTPCRALIKDRYPLNESCIMA